jgi:hypothetical protein
MKKEFKVSDRVKVFGACSCGCRNSVMDGLKGDIIDVDPKVVNGIILIPDKCSAALGACSRPFVHPRQCVRLVKKKRREIWVTRESLDEFYEATSRRGNVEIERTDWSPDLIRFVERPMK